MKLTLKEIAISNFHGMLEIFSEMWGLIVELITDLIPELLIDFPKEVTSEFTNCLNIFGKILVWLTFGIFMQCIGVFMAFMMFVMACLVVFAIILYAIIFIILYLPSIPYRWFYQRVLGPFFRFLFRKKTPECERY